MSLEIIDSVATVKNNINKILAQQLDKKLNKVIIKVESEFAKYIKSALKRSDVYDGLVNDKLNVHFGMKKPTAQKLIDDIIDQLTKQIVITYNKPKIVGGDLMASLYCSIIFSDFKDILKSKAAIFDSKDDGNDSGPLKWLEWLLIEGDRIIVTGYKIRFGNFKSPEPSRTGEAIMIPSKTNWWRVPPEYSGVIDNNWITRAITDTLAEIEVIFYELIRKNL